MVLLSDSEMVEERGTGIYPLQPLRPPVKTNEIDTPALVLWRALLARPVSNKPGREKEREAVIERIPFPPPVSQQKSKEREKKGKSKKKKTTKLESKKGMKT